jgi:hypothetical protein
MGAHECGLFLLQRVLLCNLACIECKETSELAGQARSTRKQRPEIVPIFTCIACLFEQLPTIGRVRLFAGIDMPSRDFQQSAADNMPVLHPANLPGSAGGALELSLSLSPSPLFHPCSCSMIKSSPGHAKMASFFRDRNSATSASTIVPSKALGEPINLTYTEFRPLGYWTSRKRSLAPNMEVAIVSRSHK